MILLAAVLVGVIQAMKHQTSMPRRVQLLSNVRDYAPASSIGNENYAVDGGKLFVGAPFRWTEVKTPWDVIVNAVAVDDKNSAVYIGAANELAIYRSTDGGDSWLRVLLSQDAVGGVTDIAVDSFQRLLYVGTDTAGLFQLRDVGSSMVLTAQLLLDEVVRQVAADSTGADMVFVRTDWHLYRGDNHGMDWITVSNLMSTPTALAIANTRPATVYVGTMDRGIVKSQNGQTWSLTNEGLGFLAGSRLRVDALAVDPVQPETLYAAVSYLFGSTTVHAAPAGVAMSTDKGSVWSLLTDSTQIAVVELLPVSGQTGAVYALTTESRSPMALGKAPAAITEIKPTPELAASPTMPQSAHNAWAWLVAGLAALALLFSVISDLRNRQLASKRAHLTRSHAHNNKI
jgi:photosystem II stability/assembly factor-like uncharacterized protein